MAAIQPAIAIQDVSKTYPVPLARLRSILRRNTQEPVTALREVTFEVSTGEILGLIGRNGAGKTTLAKIIATLVQPTSGSVKVNGFDSVADERKVRAQIGLATAEERSFYWRLTVQQNLMFFARLHGASDSAAKPRIQELLALFDFESLRKRRFAELSTGNRQRLAVARAMLAKPPVLLLDEPTRSLDPLAASHMRSVIRSITSSDPPVTVLLTSHNLAEVEELCSRIAIISNGRIRAVDSPTNLRRTHKTTELIQMVVKGVSARKMREAVSEFLPNFAATEHDGALTINFERESGDQRLDRAIQAIHESGGEIIECETERATLLDVLEKFESEEREIET